MYQPAGGIRIPVTPENRRKKFRLIVFIMIVTGKDPLKCRFPGSGSAIGGTFITAMIFIDSPSDMEGFHNAAPLIYSFGVAGGW